MCEFWSEGYGFDSAFSCLEATSIAHTLGRPVVAAEAFTADSSEAWKLYPAAIKNQGDWAFCLGHQPFRLPHVRPQAAGRRPGMTMGPYGVHWDRGQTWWPMAAAYHRYVTRCQFLLRQGHSGGRYPATWPPKERRTSSVRRRRPCREAAAPATVAATISTAARPAR